MKLRTAYNRCKPPTAAEVLCSQEHWHEGIYPAVDKHHRQVSVHDPRAQRFSLVGALLKVYTEGQLWSPAFESARNKVITVLQRRHRDCLLQLGFNAVRKISLGKVNAELTYQEVLKVLEDAKV